MAQGYIAILSYMLKVIIKIKNIIEANRVEKFARLIIFSRGFW